MCKEPKVLIYIPHISNEVVDKHLLESFVSAEEKLYPSRIILEGISGFCFLCFGNAGMYRYMHVYTKTK